MRLLQRFAASSFAPILLSCLVGAGGLYAAEGDLDAELRQLAARYGGLTAVRDRAVALAEPKAAAQPKKTTAAKSSPATAASAEPPEARAQSYRPGFGLKIFGVERLQLRGSAQDETFSKRVPPSIQQREGSDEVSNQQKLFEKAAPALFSYTRNFRLSEDIWSAKGALIWLVKDFRTPQGDTIPTEEAGQKGTFGGLVLASVSFDRTASSRGKSEGSTAKESNVLAGRINFNGSWVLPLDSPVANAMPQLDFRFNAVYTTDFDFRSRIGSGVIDLVPYMDWSYYGTSKEVPFLPRTTFVWTFGAHAEYSKVDQPGAKLQLRGEKDYFRVGGNISAGFPTFLTDNISVMANYRRYEPLAGRRRSNEYFDATVQWHPFPAGSPFRDTVVIVASYERGRVEIADDYVNRFRLSLGLKF